MHSLALDIQQIADIAFVYTNCNGIRPTKDRNAFEGMLQVISVCCKIPIGSANSSDEKHCVVDGEPPPAGRLEEMMSQECGDCSLQEDLLLEFRRLFLETLSLPKYHCELSKQPLMKLKFLLATESMRMVPPF